MRHPRYTDIRVKSERGLSGLTCMYLVWINPPINFTFSDDSVFLKKILAGDINSLNLLV